MHCHLWQASYENYASKKLIGLVSNNEQNDSDCTKALNTYSQTDKEYTTKFYFSSNFSLLILLSRADRSILDLSSTRSAPLNQSPTVSMVNNAMAVGMAICVQRTVWDTIHSELFGSVVSRTQLCPKFRTQLCPDTMCPKLKKNFFLKLFF